MSIFWGRQCAFVFPIYFRKYRKYTIDRWIVVYTVYTSAVISPLRQWLDSYAKTRLKMWHTFKHFHHMQYFLLPTNLVIVFVHWVSAGVLYEPRQCSLFWDYIPESKLCFCLNLCRPPGAYSIRPIGGLPMCVLSYIFAWHRGSSGQRPWVRLLHSLVHCLLARLCEDLFSSGMRPWTV